jgi:hypothetical protein
MQFIKNRLFLNRVNPVFWGAKMSIFPPKAWAGGGSCLQNKQNYINLYGFLNRDKLQAVGLGDGLIGYFAIEGVDPPGQGG